MPKRKAPSSEDIAGNVAASSGDGTDPWHLSTADVLVYMPSDAKPTTDVVAFDMDGTLIDTKSGKVFAQNANDWRLWSLSIPAKLREEKRTVVIFSNQGGVEKKKITVGDFKRKVLGVTTACCGTATSSLSIIAIYCIRMSSYYRKPCVGMLRFYEEKILKAKTNTPKCLYVGDAAGRLAGFKGKKDFACSDRAFAANCGWKFATPEEYFLGSPASTAFAMPFKPSVDSNVAVPVVSGAKQQEVIVLCGYPASGKTTFTREFIGKHSDYVHINQDKFKSWQVCVKKTEEALSKGQSVIVDNTNGDKEARGRYVGVAKAKKVACRCVVFSCSYELAHHNERYRELTDEKHSHVPGMVFNMFRKKFTEPSVLEGFSEVIQRPFAFKSAAADRDLYGLYLLEK